MLPSLCIYSPSTECNMSHQANSSKRQQLTPNNSLIMNQELILINAGNITAQFHNKVDAQKAKLTMRTWWSRITTRYAYRGKHQTHEKVIFGLRFSTYTLLTSLLTKIAGLIPSVTSFWHSNLHLYCIQVLKSRMLLDHVIITGVQLNILILLHCTASTQFDYILNFRYHMIVSNSKIWYLNFEVAHLYSPFLFCER